MNIYLDLIGDRKRSISVSAFQVLKEFGSIEKFKSFCLENNLYAYYSDYKRKITVQFDELREAASFDTGLGIAKDYYEQDGCVLGVISDGVITRKECRVQRIVREVDFGTITVAEENTVGDCESFFLWDFQVKELSQKGVEG